MHLYPVHPRATLKEPCDTERAATCDAPTPADTVRVMDAKPLGVVYLPASGTGVGMFDFIVDPDHGQEVEVGMPVAADTVEGVVVGAVVDMRTVGQARDPVTEELSHRPESGHIARLNEVIVATVQVYHSPAMRSVRAGVVRAATPEEVAAATGRGRMEWPVPAGVVRLADGRWAQVCLDGAALLGPESAHLIVNGLSGQAAKTSFASVLLKSAIAAGGRNGRRVAALVFNVKGDDLVWLDRPPGPGYELTDEDLQIYQAMQVPAEPFQDVEVWAPGLPGGGATRSRRDGAAILRWDMVQLWDYLEHVFPWMREDEKVMSFFAEFYDMLVRNPDPDQRVDTFRKFDAWIGNRIQDAMDSNNPMAWRSHHVATLRRIRRMMVSLPARFGGLVTMDRSSPSEDIPVSGFRHGQVLVVDIAGLTSDVQAIVIARTLSRLLREAEDSYLGVDHLVVFADELNMFAPAQGSDMRSVRKLLQRVATQGRYAGISLWGACQKMSKVDELVRDNAASRAVGITPDGELASGVYGRLSGGLSERIATLPKGQMVLWHYAFRGPTVVRFPRPAWQTGKAPTRRARAVDTLGLSDEAVARLTEGLDPQAVDEVIAKADDPETAIAELRKLRRPDMSKQALHAPSAFNADDPFDLG